MHLGRARVPTALVSVALAALWWGAASAAEAQWTAARDAPHPRTWEEMSRSTVRCEGSDRCPPYVGALFIAGPNADTGVLETNYCGATLVADDLALTASHCLDHRRFPEGSSCRGRVFMAFPRSGEHPAEQAECDAVLEISSILASSRQDLFHADYALIRLTRAVHRPRAALSSEGLADGAEMRLYVPNDYSGIDRGDRYELTLVERRCRVSHGTVVLPESRHDASGMVLLAPCYVVVGNSGSAVLDGEHGVRGLVTGRDYASSGIGLRANALRHLPEETFRLVQHPSQLMGTYVTNLACVSLRSVDFASRAAEGHCRDGFYASPVAWRSTIRRANEQFDRAIARSRRAARQDVQRWIAREPAAQGIRWQVHERRRRGGLEVRPVAVCLRRPIAHAGESTSISTPVAQVHVAIDARFVTTVASSTSFETLDPSGLSPCSSSRRAR